MADLTDQGRNFAWKDPLPDQARMLTSLGSLKIGLKPFSESQPNAEKGNLIPEILGKAKKIKGDKLPKVTGWPKLIRS